MASSAISGVGATFKRGDGASSEEFTALSEVRRISALNKTRATIDVTNLDSTGGYREWIAGFRDAGVVSIEFNYAREAYDLLVEDFDNDTTPRNYEVVLPDTGETTLDFAALITEVGPLEIGPDDAVICRATFKISGKPTLTS